MSECHGDYIRKKEDMNTRLNLIGLLFLTLLVISCNQSSESKNFDYGHIENNKYINSYFGLELMIPEKWVVQTKEQMELLAEMGRDLVGGDNEEFKAKIRVSEINTANLLGVFQHDLREIVEFNPNIILIAENLKSDPDIQSGSDYLYHVRKYRIVSQMQFSDIDEEFRKEILDSQEFYTMNCSYDYLGIKITQRTYSTVKDGFCLSAIVTFANEDQKKDLENIISSIKFKR